MMIVLRSAIQAAGAALSDRPQLAAGMAAEVAAGAALFHPSYWRETVIPVYREAFEMGPHASVEEQTLVARLSELRGLQSAA